MTNPIALNYEAHRNTRVITSRGANFGENTHIVPVVADELQSLALEYPVFLTKDDETGRFELTAMLGFEQGENLFLQGEQWDASYVPLHVLRQPFLVAQQSDKNGEAGEGSAIISLDMESKRVQESQGEALFNEDGSKTAYLENITALLSQLMSGIKSTDAFIRKISELDMIESAGLKVTFEGKGDTRYEGLYAISDEKLSELDGDVLQELHKKGYLQACYLLLASMGNIRKLIARKNALLAKS